jgi:hypothetical protein
MMARHIITGGPAFAPAPDAALFSMISAAINALSEKLNGQPYGPCQDRGDHQKAEYDYSAADQVADDA